MFSQQMFILQAKLQSLPAQLQGIKAQPAVKELGSEG
jgi:hypothetical protein